MPTSGPPTTHRWRGLATRATSRTTTKRWPWSSSARCSSTPRREAPYQVRQLRGARHLERQDPDIESMPFFEGTYTTRAYPVDAFSPRSGIATTSERYPAAHRAAEARPSQPSPRWRAGQSRRLAKSGTSSRRRRARCSRCACRRDRSPTPARSWRSRAERLRMDQLDTRHRRRTPGRYRSRSSQRTDPHRTRPTCARRRGRPAATAAARSTRARSRSGTPGSRSSCRRRGACPRISPITASAGLAMPPT